MRTLIRITDVATLLVSKPSRVTHPKVSVAAAHGLLESSHFLVFVVLMCISGHLYLVPFQRLLFVLSRVEVTGLL